ncbi:MAG: ASCH domain-containing protein [Pseudolysinimonas sp.]
MRELRILTVRQPWAWAIVHGGKDVENRSRNLAGKYRGPVAIHAAANELPADQHFEAAKAISTITGYLPLFTLPEGLGAILGVVDLVDVHRAADCVHGLIPTPCSEWAEPGSWHLKLANPRPLAKSIPWRGMLGLQHAPVALAERILAEVAA